MTARGALVAFGVLLTSMGLVLALAAQGSTEQWGVVVGAGMIVVAILVTAIAAIAKPHRDHERRH